jgi:allantoicase
MIALDTTTDFACITNELGNAKLDCEILEYGKAVALVIQPFISDPTTTNKRPSKL